MRAREQIDRHSDLGPSSKDWQPGSVGRDEDFTPEKDLWTKAHKGGLGAGRPGEDVQGGEEGGEGPGEDVQPGTQQGGRSWQSHRPRAGDKEEQLEEELEDTFPASDPLTVTQPGVTGWEIDDNPGAGARSRSSIGDRRMQRGRGARTASPGSPWLALSLALLPALILATMAVKQSRRSPPRRS
jgi:hypothetical protein